MHWATIRKTLICSIFLFQGLAGVSGDADADAEVAAEGDEFVEHVARMLSSRCEG